MITTPSSFTAIVPMRAGSRGLRGKNIRLLRGLPLYMHSVRQAQATGAVRILVTTDVDSVLAQPPEGAEVFRRPALLANDDTPMAPVVADIIARAGLKGILVLLQPTSPLRASDDIAQAISLFQSGRFDLVMSVASADASVLKWGTESEGRFIPLSLPAYCFSNRQSLPPVFRPNGAIYVFDAQWFAERGKFDTERIGCYVMPEERSFDIDTEDDFVRCEAMMSSDFLHDEGVSK
jgi:N-acylneuraminate cytidylyltransferase